LNKLPTLVAFVDLKKTFDSVDRDFLWYRLCRYGIVPQCRGSVYAAVPHDHSVGCMVLEIQLFFLIPPSKASCFVEALHLVEDV